MPSCVGKKNVFERIKQYSVKSTLFCLLDKYSADFVFRLVYASLTSQQTYSSSLSESSQVYFRDCDKPNFYYYESIKVEVVKSGHHTFRSHCDVDAYGVIYRNKFNPFDPLENLLERDDDSASGGQFKIDVDLANDMTYVLVMTTYQSRQTGLFQIVVSGTNDVHLTHLSK